MRIFALHGCAGFRSAVSAPDERDDVSSNRLPASSLCFSMIFFGKPVSTFPDHALDLVGHVVGQKRDEIALNHLLDQIEGVDDLANLDDAAITQGIERRKVELHDPVVAPLAE